MVFSSLPFICVFLPVVMALYYVIPSQRFKNILLIVVSLLFYAYGEPIYVFLMLGSIVFNYCFGLGLKCCSNNGKKAVLSIAVVFNIGLLIVFKYLELIINTISLIVGKTLPTPHITLPIGISFFTFQALSYVIDVYRGTVSSERNILHVMLYISFFPQLIAGPIVKYHDVAQQISNRIADTKEIVYGIERFIIGLAKKVWIANTMAVAVDTLYSTDPTRLNALSVWLAAVAYLLQIYFDFSGYSDMAIGLGHIFGFAFKENFDYPYTACSIQEFWRRWHISLSTWFKEYVYIPLGGNRKGRARTFLNKWIVFATTGLWHGANWTFLVWGLWHGLWITLEGVIPVRKLPKWFRHVSTMIVVCIGFVMFRSETIKQGMVMVGKMFSGLSFSPLSKSILIAQLNPLFIAMFIIGCISCLPFCKEVWNYLARHNQNRTEILGYCLCIGLLLLCMLNLSGGSYNPFIYFRF